MSSPRQGSGDIWKKSSTIAPMTLKTSLLTIFIYTSQSFIEVICYGEKKIKLDHKNYTDYYFDKVAGIKMDKVKEKRWKRLTWSYNSFKMPHSQSISSVYVFSRQM